MRWDLTLEKKAGRALTPTKATGNLKAIAARVSRNQGAGFSATVGTLSEPEPITIDGKDCLRYLVPLRITNKKSSTPEMHKKRFDKLLPIIKIKAARYHWNVLINGSSPATVPGDSNGQAEKPNDVPAKPRVPMLVPELTAHTHKKFFSHVYERGPHLRLIHDSVKTYRDSNHEIRGHTLLYGVPAAAKTTCYLALAKWYQEANANIDGEGVERVKMIDATTATKAGVENMIIQDAQTNCLPDIYCFEEIEKFPPDHLMGLLSVMDSRGQLQKTNARIGRLTVTTKVLIWATCNDAKIIQDYRSGALWSRFTHRWECVRPGREVMMKILLDQGTALPGFDPLWAEAALEYGYDTMKTDDPRTIIGLLDGGARLLDGTYFRDIESITMSAQRKHTEYENAGGHK